MLQGCLESIGEARPLEPPAGGLLRGKTHSKPFSSLRQAVGGRGFCPLCTREEVWNFRWWVTLRQLVEPPTQKTYSGYTPRTVHCSLPAPLSAGCVDQNRVHRQLWGIPNTKINIQPCTHKHLRKMNAIKEKHPIPITEPASRAGRDPSPPPSLHTESEAKLSSLLI